MKTIHKQVLRVTDEQELKLPFNYIIRKIGFQEDTYGNKNIYMWYEFNPEEKEIEECYIRVYGTGQNISEGLIYLDTVQVYNYVWHIYQFIKSI